MPFNSTLFWLLLGAGLCSIELVLPTAFVAFVMGLSALLVAVVSPLLPLGLQVALWMLLSAVGVFGSRRFIRPRSRMKSLDDVRAETLTEIAPGQAGRVMYEGNSWLARCEDEKLAIAPGQRVYVVRREGTTLVVLPENLLTS